MIISEHGFVLFFFFFLPKAPQFCCLKCQNWYSPKKKKCVSSFRKDSFLWPLGYNFQAAIFLCVYIFLVVQEGRNPSQPCTTRARAAEEKETHPHYSSSVLNRRSKKSQVSISLSISAGFAGKSRLAWWACLFHWHERQRHIDVNRK